MRRSNGGPPVYGLEIDRAQCAGHHDCLELAPGVFELDRDNVPVPVDPAAVSPARLLETARACPRDAIRVLDEAGEQLWP